MLVRRYSPKDRASYVYTIKYPFVSLDGGFSQQFISTLDDPKEILCKLENRKPNLLSTYPCVLDEMICERYLSEGTNPQVFMDLIKKGCPTGLAVWSNFLATT